MLAAGAGPRARRSLVPGSQPAADGQLDPCQRPWAREPSLTPGSSPPSFSPGRTGAAADKLNSICVRLIVGPGSLPEELHPGTHSRSLRGSSRSGGGKRAAARQFCLSCEPSPVQKSLSFPARLRELAQSFKAALRPVMWCCWLCRVSELILPQNFGLKREVSRCRARYRVCDPGGLEAVEDQAYRHRAFADGGRGALD
jgi:hypothetical protein